MDYLNIIIMSEHAQNMTHKSAVAAGHQGVHLIQHTATGAATYSTSMLDAPTRNLALGSCVVAGPTDRRTDGQTDVGRPRDTCV